jgi:hypothetical protein
MIVEDANLLMEGGLYFINYGISNGKQFAGSFNNPAVDILIASI